MPKIRIKKLPEAANGLQIEGNQYKNLSPDTVEIGGQLHENGGTDLHYNGNNVEAEKGETLSIMNDGSAIIYGNMINPITGNKFKKDSKTLADKENKLSKIISKSGDLLKDNDPHDKWESLSFNS